MPHLRGRAATDGALPAARRRLDARRSGTDSLVGSVRRSGRVGPRPSRAPAAAAAAAAPTVTIRAGRRRRPHLAPTPSDSPNEKSKSGLQFRAAAVTK